MGLMREECHTNVPLSVAPELVVMWSEANDLMIDVE